jgi:hypothetical protein
MSILFFLCISHAICLAQENTEYDEPFHYHSLSLVISHAHVFNGEDIDGNSQVLSLPSWGIDYNYQFHPKWTIGLHTDIIVEKFAVQKSFSSDKDEVIERSYPIAPAVMAVYEATDHWSFSLGAGGEFAKEENFFLNRIGVEYGVELPKEWEVAGSINYDIKWGGYDTWVLGLGIAKAF